MRFAEQWNWCTVEAIRDVTPRIREFRLRPDNGHVPPFPAGSHISVNVLIDGQPARRSYSLVANSDPGTYRIAVRRAPDSRGGSRGKIVVDTPVLPYQAPDISEITGIDEDDAGDSDATTEAVGSGSATAK